VHRKALFASSLEELKEHFRTAAAFVPAPHLLIQEFVPGGGRRQLSYCALLEKGRVLASFTARRLRQYPIDFGMSSSFVEAVHLPELDGPSRRLLATLGLSGMIELEYKQHETSGELYLLDANVRAWAWHDLCSACGVDFIDLEYRRVTGAELPALTPKYGVRWRRAITDIPAGLAAIRAGKMGVASYLRSLGGATRPSVMDLRDPMPALLDLPIAAIRTVRSRRGNDARPAHEGAVPGTHPG
jgi:predicted ATP-grasp superfamily ATP-dependent carboligase